MIETGKSRTSADAAGPVLPVECESAESRLDPISGGVTIFAPQRGQRPEEFVDTRDAVHHNLQCPFCHGNERTTPAAVWVARLTDDDDSEIVDLSRPDADVDDWAVRVVPNKFPAVRSVAHSGCADSQAGLLQRRPVIGGHEVIIESRHHVQSLSELDLPELTLAFRAYRDRLRHWRNVSGVQYLSLFKNVGLKAGASLRHTHSQLIATDQIPPAVQASLDRMTRHRATTGCCLQCDLIRAEEKTKQRVIWNDGKLIAYCPFASPLPMLVRITTLKHVACFEDLSRSTLEYVARITGRVIRWIEMIRPGASYNLCLRTLPPGAARIDDAHHWSLDIFPRMTHVAGFEWSSQCMINPILPETAAARYRTCVEAEDPRML